MKGYLHTLESMIAGILILSTILIIYNGSVETSSFESVSMADSAYECLKYLDSKGILRHYALNNNTQINAYISSCMPKTLNFSIGFCDGCATANTNKTTASIIYIIAGEGSTFNPIVVNMLVWSLI